MKMTRYSFLLIGLLAFGTSLLSACGDSDELTPEVLTIADEAISAPVTPALTDDERDAISAQQKAHDEAVAAYGK
ncbi:hypothetical protein [Prevotella sp.]|uniref:hypothetical protein n=1 Tax=Prevotella sp. TaxID=59823 RepID=UPI002F92B894